MEEQQVVFGQEDIRLEGLYAHGAKGNRTVGAIVSHPHPPRGGNMHNPVVAAVSEALLTGGISTLRYNFRGVGKSLGTYDNGRGEQDDVLAAISFIESQGIQNILPAGYSFGAWVNAGVIIRRELLPAIFIAPPFDLFSFDIQLLRGKVGLIICGDEDKYCPLEKVKGVAAELACRLDVIPGADHFFQARDTDLADCVEDYLTKLKP